MVSSFRRRARSLEILNVFTSFFNNQSTGGVILLVCTLVALICSNTPSLHFIHDIWNIKGGIHFGSFSFELPLSSWINDALMAIFFFVVGLEIKREMLVGELSSIKHATLPLIAAIGGMVVPALIYMLFNNGTPSASGWGIPMATDIAFVLGVLYVLGKRVPVGLKVFLTALAIVDDIGAILVIAIFYPSHDLHFTYIFYALIVILILWILKRGKVHIPLLYVLCGVLLWYFIFMSGIHATIAGVILAMMIPSKSLINEVRFFAGMKYLIGKFKEAGSGSLNILANPEQQEIIHKINTRVEKINPLIHRFEFRLHPWVTFLILPLFALSNAGVALDTNFFSFPIHPVTSGIFFGLVLGKPIGILLFSWIAVKLKISELPSNSNWMQILSLGILAGIGFTMSLFIDTLAFSDPDLVNIGKASILFTSLCTLILGTIATVISTKGNVTVKNKWTKHINTNQ